MNSSGTYCLRCQCIAPGPTDSIKHSPSCLICTDQSLQTAVFAKIQVYPMSLGSGISSVAANTDYAVVRFVTQLFHDCNLQWFLRLIVLEPKGPHLLDAYALKLPLGVCGRSQITRKSYINNPSFSIPFLPHSCHSIATHTQRFPTYPAIFVAVGGAKELRPN